MTDYISEATLGLITSSNMLELEKPQEELVSWYIDLWMMQ